MRFSNRIEAGRKLAECLTLFQEENPIVLALPRGGVPVGGEIASLLKVPLDLFIVKKISSPDNPELGIGAVTEDGRVWINTDVTSLLRLTPDEIDQASTLAKHALDRQIQTLRAGHPRTSVADRVVVIVDDGVATGATLLTAVASLRQQGAARIIAAAPVSSREAAEKLREAVDQFICLYEPDQFHSVGQWYDVFTQVSDLEVHQILRKCHFEYLNTHLKRDIQDPEHTSIAGHYQEVQIPTESGGYLRGELALPRNIRAWAIFAHGSGSNYQSPRNLRVARILNRHRLATLLFDLLTPEESLNRENIFNIPFLAQRLVLATKWLKQQKKYRGLPIGYFGASTGAAAAIRAAAEMSAESPDSKRANEIFAIVSRGGRPDLAAESLAQVTAPTLLLVGSWDEAVVALNRRAAAILPHAKVVVIPKATHLFEEPGKLKEVAEQAADWFMGHLKKTEVRREVGK